MVSGEDPLPLLPQSGAGQELHPLAATANGILVSEPSAAAAAAFELRGELKGRKIPRVSG